VICYSSAGSTCSHTQRLPTHLLPCACACSRALQDPALRRHLLRLWLAPEDGRPLPQHYAEAWHSVVPGARGGIVVEGGADVIPLVAEKGN
jgi:hypothetical protein